MGKTLPLVRTSLWILLGVCLLAPKRELDLASVVAALGSHLLVMLMSSTSLHVITKMAIICTWPLGSRVGWERVPLHVVKLGELLG